MDDPDDDPVVETALYSGAMHIVTDDRALLRAAIPGVHVVTVEALVRSPEGPQWPSIGRAPVWALHPEAVAAYRAEPFSCAHTSRNAAAHASPNSGE